MRVIGVITKFNQLKHKLETEFAKGGVSEMFDYGGLIVTTKWLMPHNSFNFNELKDNLSYLPSYVILSCFQLFHFV